MFYYEDEQYRVYADIAYRIGQLIKSYESVNNPKFDTTLNLIALQSLLTNFAEQKPILAGVHHAKEFINRPLYDIPKIMGISKSDIKRDTFLKQTTVKDFFTHLRNAVSHPVAGTKNYDADYATSFPNTGYSAQKNEDGEIESISFWDSPDVKNSQLKWSYDNQEKAIDGLNRLKREVINPEKLTLGPHPSKPHKQTIYYGERRLCRVFEVKLSVSTLSTLVGELSSYLAEPIKEKWHNQTIEKLTG